MAKPSKRHDLKCGDCGAPMTLRASPKFEARFYKCTRWPDCEGTLGAKPDGSPQGIPANKATRKARIQAHRVFDQLWKNNVMPRSKAYSWMRKKMNLSHSQAHISCFTEEQCLELIRLVKTDFAEYRTRYDVILYDDSV